VIVLDEIDPRSGESMGQLRELRGGEPERFERRAEEGPSAGAGELA